MGTKDLLTLFKRVANEYSDFIRANHFTFCRQFFETAVRADDLEFLLPLHETFLEVLQQSADVCFHEPPVKLTKGILVLLLKSGVSRNFVETMCEINSGQMFNFEIPSSLSRSSAPKGSTKDFYALENFTKALKSVHGIQQDLALIIMKRPLKFFYDGVL